MPLSASSLVWYKAQESSNQATNGGRLSAVAVTDAVKNNLFPDVSQAERAAGSVNYRKLFMKVDDPLIGLQNGVAFIETASVGDDIVTLFSGSPTNTQATITGAELQVGMAVFSTPALAGDTAITVTVENALAQDIIFHDGDVLRLTDTANVNVAGTVEYATISVGGVGAYIGNDITLTLTAGLANPFSVGNKCSSTLPLGTVDATTSPTIVTSVGGAYNDIVNPLALNNQSTITETWTLSFTSAAAFDIIGATVGIVGSGTTAANSLPNNPDYALPYFTLASAGFSGAFISGDTVVFTTAAAAAPVWLKRVVPAGAASLTANSTIIAVEGESA